MGDTNTAKQPLVLHHLDDIVVLGRYTFLVCLLAELAFLSQLSNTMYMVYAGELLFSVFSSLLCLALEM